MNKKEKGDLAYHIASMLNSEVEEVSVYGEILLESFPVVKDHMVTYNRYFEAESLSKIIRELLPDFNAFVVCTQKYKDVFSEVNKQLPIDSLVEVCRDYLDESDLSYTQIVNKFYGTLNSKYSTLRYIINSGLWSECLGLYIEEDSTAYKFYTGAFVVEND